MENNQTPLRKAPYETEDEIVSIGALLVSLSPYRKLILVLVVSAAVLLACGSVLYYVTNPPRKTVSMRFLLKFDGAERGEYPSGVPFNPAEIVSTPVIRGVFEHNELGQYVGFSEFKNSLVVNHRLPELDLLRQEYAAKLDDRNLSPMERERIREEFEEKRDAIMRPEYRISYAYRAGLTSPPPELVQKALYDILGGWADYAADKRGALKYRIPVYSPEILQPDMLEDTDHVVGLDILRRYLQRIRSTVRGLMEIPGAETVRAGEGNHTLFEINDFINDMIEYEVEPLYSIVASAGLGGDIFQRKQYIRHRLFALEQEREAARSRLDLIEDSLRSYAREKHPPRVSSGSGAELEPEHGDRPMLIPQFGDGFLDRITQMEVHDEDLRFRQKKIDDIIQEGLQRVDIDKEYRFYERVYEELTGEASEITARKQEDLSEMVEGRYASLVSQITRHLKAIHEIYGELSEHNLHPRTMLYEPTSPLTVSSAFPTRKLAMLNLAALALFTLLTLYGFLLYAGRNRCQR